MTRRPFGPQDRTWLLFRLFVLGLALAVHPLPFDLHGYGLIIPARSAKSAYIVFECLQTVVFAAALFYGDMLPGVRRVTAYYRRLAIEMREAPSAMKFVKTIPFALGVGIAVWLIVSPVEAVVNAIPQGSARFFAATAFFIVDRLAAIIVLTIVVNASDDDDPGVRRESIARSRATLSFLVRVRAIAKAPSARPEEVAGIRRSAFLRARVASVIEESRNIDRDTGNLERIAHARNDTMRETKVV